MIRIEGAHIRATAVWWADTLSNFLNEKHKDKKRPRYKFKKKNKLFETRLEKYKSLFFDLCRDKKYKKIPFNYKNSTWRDMENFLHEKKNLIGNEDTIPILLNYHENHIKSHPLAPVIQTVFVEINKDFTAQYAHDIVSRLRIRTCPYCNRNYTFAVDKVNQGDFTTRPEFDHFYNKSDYPLLAVTFFNLVPSCPVCNHGKGKRKAALNPYFQGFKTRLVVTNKATGNILNRNEIMKLSDESAFALNFDNPSDDEEFNINAFGLRQLYDQHKDYVMEIIEKTAFYDNLTQKGLADSFQGIVHSSEEVHNMIFGKYLSEAEQAQRPMSRLSHDILEQLGHKI